MSNKQSLPSPHSESPLPKNDHEECLPIPMSESNIEGNKKWMIIPPTAKQGGESHKNRRGSTAEKTKSNLVSPAEGLEARKGQAASIISEFRAYNKSEGSRTRTGRLIINYENMRKKYQICISELAQKTLQQIIETLDMEKQPSCL